MTQCPICKKDHVFGEQVTQSDYMLDLTYYDCPACGAFRINPEASHRIKDMDDEAVWRLRVWVNGYNRTGIIPTINVDFVTTLLTATEKEPCVA